MVGAVGDARAQVYGQRDLAAGAGFNRAYREVAKRDVTFAAKFARACQDRARLKRPGGLVADVDHFRAQVDRRPGGPACSRGDLQIAGQHVDVGGQVEYFHFHIVVVLVPGAHPAYREGVDSTLRSEEDRDLLFILAGGAVELLGAVGREERRPQRSSGAVEAGRDDQRLAGVDLSLEEVAAVGG